MNPWTCPSPRLRTIRVYEVGKDVQNPGAYDVSSLSTPLNALFAAGGPTTRGSLQNRKAIFAAIKWWSPSISYELAAARGEGQHSAT